MLQEKLTKRQKGVLLTAMLIYFVAGFLVIVIVLGYVLGPNLAGVISLLYLVVGWYLLVRRNGLFNLMGIKHD